MPVTEGWTNTEKPISMDQLAESFGGNQKGAPFSDLEVLVGIEIQTKDGQFFLIGNVNTHGGVCDDCCAIRYDERDIVAWRRWHPGKEEAEK